MRTATIQWAAAFRASLLAALAVTAFTYAFAPLFRASLGDFAPLVARRLGLVAPGTGDVIALATGLAALTMAAVIWGLIFAVIRAGVPGPDWAVGLVYGFATWLVGQFAVVPALGVPVAAARLPLTLAEHLLFGVFLAWFMRGARTGVATPP